MSKYNFKIQFCRKASDSSTEKLFEGTFFAPTEEIAKQFADEISTSFMRLGLIPDYEVRPYEEFITPINES